MNASKRVRVLWSKIRGRLLWALEPLGFSRSARPRTFEIAYVILVSSEVHNYMTRLQLDILRRYGANPGLTASPHITLKLGFEVSEIEPFAAYLDRIAGDIEPFEICVRNIDVFDGGIIFLDVEQDPRLENLRRRILRDLSEKYGVEPYPLEGDQYRFHATLAYGLSNRDFERAWKELKDLKVEFRFVFDTLGLFCHTGDGWITYRRAVLSLRASRLS